MKGSASIILVLSTQPVIIHDQTEIFRENRTGDFYTKITKLINIQFNYFYWKFPLFAVSECEYSRH